MNLDDLEKLLAAATPGPWKVEERKSVTEPGAYVEINSTVEPLPSGHDETMFEMYACSSEHHFGSPTRSNAALIVAAVNALPSLIASARRVEEYRSALEVALAILSTPDTEEGAVSRVARAELVVFKALQQPPTAKE